MSNLCQKIISGVIQNILICVKKLGGAIQNPPHYSREFELRTIALGIKTLNISHTGHHINAAIEDVLVRWNIHDKMVAMVIDNGSNICVAIRQFSCIRLRCLAHTLQLAVQKALEVTFVCLFISNRFFNQKRLISLLVLVAISIILKKFILFSTICTQLHCSFGRLR
jgi:hypothetical protein